MNKKKYEQELKRIRSGNVDTQKVILHIVQSEADKEGHYIPAMVHEGVKGYSKTLIDWKIKDYSEALKIAQEGNLASGFSIETQQAIITYSMFG
jgi:hypothetical protein